MTWHPDPRDTPETSHRREVKRAALRRFRVPREAWELLAVVALMVVGAFWLGVLAAFFSDAATGP